MESSFQQHDGGKVKARWIVSVVQVVGVVCALLNPFMGALFVVASFFFGRMYELDKQIENLSSTSTATKVRS